MTNYHRLGSLKLYSFIISQVLSVRSVGKSRLSCVLCLEYHKAVTKALATSGF